MRMGRKSAFVLLVLMALWAAAPALAGLTQAGQHACCHGMAMQDCDLPAAMHCSDCCLIHPADIPMPHESAAGADQLVSLAPSAVLDALMFSPDAGKVILPASVAPPPLGSPGASSVLRI